MSHDANIPKGIGSDDISGVGSVELPIYNSTDSKSIEELISKEIGMAIEVKVLDDSDFILLED